MKKAKWVQGVCILLSAVWMVVIFLFSAQDGEESSRTSGKVVDLVAPVVVPGYDQLDESEKVEKQESVSFFVRKGSHFSEYAILGLLLSFSLPYGRMKRLYSSLIAIGIGVLYAISDEIHQNFSDGRSPAVLDVLIDLSGVLAGVLCACLILWLAGRWKKREKKARKKKKRTPTV